MTEVKGILEFAKLGGKNEGIIILKTLEYSSADELRGIQEMLHVANQMLHDNSYIAVMASSFSVNKNGDVSNWKYDISTEHILSYKDTDWRYSMNNRFIHATLNNLEVMTQPVGEMSNEEKIFLLHCLVLDIFNCRPVEDDPKDKRFMRAEELTEELNMKKFSRRLIRFKHYIRDVSRLEQIFDYPVEEGGLIGMGKLHNQTMTILDKSGAFKHEARTHIKLGSWIFEDARNLEAKYNDSGMVI